MYNRFDTRTVTKDTETEERRGEERGEWGERRRGGEEERRREEERRGEEGRRDGTGRRGQGRQDKTVLFISMLQIPMWMYREKVKKIILRFKPLHLILCERLFLF